MDDKDARIRELSSQVHQLQWDLTAEKMISRHLTEKCKRLHDQESHLRGRMLTAESQFLRDMGKYERERR